MREVTWPVRADGYSLGEQLGIPVETRKVQITEYTLLGVCQNLEVVL